MEDEHTVKLKVKVQVIYYVTPDDVLGKEYATSEKRINLTQGKTILENRQILVKEVLKTMYEFIDIQMTTEEIEKHIIL